MGRPLSQDMETYGYFQASSGSTAVLQTTVFDMTGFEGLMLIGYRNATLAETSGGLFVQTGTASGTLSDTTGIQNLAQTCIYLDNHRPDKRFVQGNFRATASGEQRTLIALRYGARSLPTTQPASTTGKVLYTPGSGTATG